MGVKAIQVDTRQKITAHENKEIYFKEHGIETHRSKLIVGDYALPPKVSIDTKQNMGEIAQNIGGSAAEHKRFRNELILAKQIGCKLFVLVENLDGISELSQVQWWTNPRLKECPTAIDGNRLYKAMCTMQERYGVTFLFCKPEQSGAIIERILNEYGNE